MAPSTPAVNLDQVRAGKGGTVTRDNIAYAVAPIPAVLIDRIRAAEGAQYIGVAIDVVAQLVPDMPEEVRAQLSVDELAAVIAVAMNDVEAVANLAPRDDPNPPAPASATSSPA